MVRLLLSAVFATALLVLAPDLIRAQCPSGQVDVEIAIHTDNWGYETGWTLQTGGTLIAEVDAGTYGNNQFYSQDLCVDTGACIDFELTDTYGDGIVAGSGFYAFIVDGDTILQGQNDDFGTSVGATADCPPGSQCSDALDALPDTVYEGVFDNSWYTFVADSTGNYEITACDSNTCDTKLWLYDGCTGNISSEDEDGALLYNNDALGICAPQSVISANLIAGNRYYVRVGDNADDCTGSVFWSYTYQGPVTGCLDTFACNFDPLATVLDTCYYAGSPDCPDGPDLFLDGPYTESTMFVTTEYFDPTDPYDVCQIDEGCLLGLGSRTLLRFGTRIENVGELDYFIGLPSSDPDQFDFINCHGHTHYKGYAEYLLLEQDLTEAARGYKAGFCVMDLSCPPSIPAQYGCSTMGITAGCADIYSSGLSCQWIDITDVDTGLYTFILRTNWDNSPDALGRFETDYSNNWAQVCVRLEYDLSGDLQATIEPNCAVYVDCAGDTLGTAEPDCAGICDGTAQYGDINGDEHQDLTDAGQYLTEIIQGTVSGTCYDLDADGAITVYDAALIQDCHWSSDDGHEHGGANSHQHCEFPYGYVNPADSVFFTIMDHDPVARTVDIGMRNPNNDVLGYQFRMSGIRITGSSSLVPALNYPAIGHTNDDEVIVLSVLDSVIDRSVNHIPVVQLQYDSLLDTLICIDSVIDVVSGGYWATATGIDGSCVVVDTTPADTDGDGLTDEDEINIHGTDPNDADSDGDGLDDGVEILVHSTDPNAADSDGDSLSDGDEVIIHGTDPHEVDTDGDGIDDDQELTDGTDPLDPNDPGSPTSIRDQASVDLSLRPNPASDRVFIEAAFTDISGWTIDVFDMLGRRMEIPVDRTVGAVQLRTDALVAGVYSVRLTNGDRQTSGRFVIAR